TYCESHEQSRRQSRDGGIARAVVIEGTVGGPNTRPNRRRELAFGKVIELDQVRRTKATSAKEICFGRLGDIQEAERQFECRGFVGVGPRSDIGELQVQGEAEIVIPI